jgi:hypothetical protein
MKWKNAVKDTLPPDNEEVLISVNGVNYISIFKADKNLFKIENEQLDTHFRTDEHTIYWTEVIK